MNGETVAIIGLGLIGGSLARDLRDAGARVLGCDVDPATTAAALADRVIDAILPADLRGADHADIIVCAVPVHRSPAVLRQVAALPAGRTRLITDVGSTKASTVAAAMGLGLGPRFVGGHPLAGDHRAGWSAAREHLFAGATVFLCATATTRPAALAAAHDMWRAVGARPVNADAEAHDQRVALSSHLPQVAATALARVLAARNTSPSDLGAGGRDMTRLAASPASLWTGISLDNVHPLSAGIDALRAELDALQDALADGAADAVHAWFQGGARWRADGDAAPAPGDPGSGVR